MADEKNLWANIFSDGAPNSTDNVIPYFEEQCNNIESSSQRKVHARFERLQMVPKSTGLAAITAISSIAGAVETEKDPLPQQDANDFYDPQTYAFDVYNETYKFRVLTIELGATYPIEVKLDKGIAEGLGELLDGYVDPMGLCRGIWINDDCDLNNFMKMLTEHSVKLRYIVVKLATG